MRHGAAAVDRTCADHVVHGDRHGCDPDQHEAQSTRHLEHDGHESGGHPAHLEPGLELRECTPAIGIGCVALHHCFEREPADRRGEVHRAGQQHARDHATEQRRPEPGERDHRQRRDKHRLLAQLRAHQRGDRVAGHRQQARETERQAEPHEAGLLRSEPEEQMEERESGARPQEQHRRRGEHHPIGVQLRFLVAARRPSRDHLAGQPGRGHEREPEDRGRVEQRRLGTDRLLEQGCRHDRHRADEAGDQTQLRVRLDEFLLAAHHRRHERALGDRVGLLRHHRHEREREQQEAVGVEGHQDRQHHAHHGDRLDHQASPAGHAIDRRADQRRDEQERHEADAEEEHHAAPRRVGVEAEEHGVGQGDGHRRVAGCHGRVGAGQTTEPGTARRDASRRGSAGRRVGAHDGIVRPGPVRSRCGRSRS